MHVKIEITYSLSEALKDLGQASQIQPGDDVIVLSAADKFFVGGGCEAEAHSPAAKEAAAGASRPVNVSVCLNSPFN